jgi:hypothetical protein
MKLSVVFAIATVASTAGPSVDACVDGILQTEPAGQSVNGGAPQKIAPVPRTRERQGQEHWSDAMNTTRTPAPAARDEYGAPKVTPPRGQGTDNAGSLPVQERRAPQSTSPVADPHGH